MVSTWASLFKIIRPIIFFYNQGTFPQPTKFLLKREHLFSKLLDPQCFPTVREFFQGRPNFLDQRIFPQLRNFTPLKEIFRNQKYFPVSRKFSKDKQIIRSQGIFPQSRKFFFWWKNFSTIKEICQNQEIFHSQGHFYIVKEIFYKKDLLDKGNFLQTTKFSTIFFSLIKGVCHNKNFYVVKRFFRKQISKGFSKS